jgi:Tol biopolymer transport system component
VYPAWSPDRSRVAFSSQRRGTWEIYVMSSAGGDQTQLTHTNGVSGGPRWSPDGTQIVFESDRDGDVEVWVMDASGGSLRQLTHNVSNDRRPDWR